jgi:hypothetical protein
MAVDDAYTKVLLHMDGADASTTLTDESGKAWTPGGNAQVDTAQSVFGGAALLCDGTGDYIDTPDSDDFAMGSGDFTVDFRVRWNSVTSAQYIFGQEDSGGDNAKRALGAYMSGGGANLAVGFYSGTSSYPCNAGAVSINTWYHVALVRYGNALTIYMNGTKIGNSVNVTGVTMNNSAYKFAVGRLGEYPNASFNGWIDEFRISKGIARWTADFTPPVAPYAPAIIPAGGAIFNPIFSAPFRGAFG